MRITKKQLKEELIKKGVSLSKKSDSNASENFEQIYEAMRSIVDNLSLQIVSEIDQSIDNLERAEKRYKELNLKESSRDCKYMARGFYNARGEVTKYSR
tara:strand:- start:69 stop:365 length:297 start_codon:yes stop_codon:yes gene_type:complete